MTEWADQIARKYHEKPLVLNILRDQKKLDSSLDYGVTQNPETSAKDQVNARSLDIPVDTAVKRSSEVDQIIRKQNLTQKLDKTEFTKRFFSDPNNAAIAHDDADELISIENVLKAGEKIKHTGQAAAVGATQATIGIAESIWRTPEAIGRVLDGLNKMVGIKAASDWVVKQGWDPFARKSDTGAWQIAIEELTHTGEIADRIGDAQDILQKNYAPFKRMAEKGQQADRALVDALGGDFVPLAEVMVDPEAWAGFIGQAAPSLYAAYKSGGSIPFIAWLESMEVAQNASEFEEMTGDKVDPVAFVQAAAQVALVNSYLERLGLEKVFGNMGKGTLSSFIKGALFEGGTEAMQEFNTNAAARIAFDPEQSLTQGVVPGFMGGAGAGGPAGAFSAMGRASGPNSEFAGDLVRSENALKAQEELDQIVEAVMASKTKERDNVRFRAHLEEMVGVENAVFMAPEDAQAFFQSHPEVIEAFPEDTRESVTEALTTNGDVAIPKADYLTYMSDFHSEIRDMVRNDIDGMSAKEASQWAETGLQEVEIAAEKIHDEMDVNSDFARSAAKVQADMESQIIATGRVVPEDAKKVAALRNSFIVVAAEKEGLTPEGLLEKYPQVKLRFQGEPLTVPALNQEEELRTRIKDTKGKPLTVYRGRIAPPGTPGESSVVWTTPSPHYAGFYTTGQGKTPFDYKPEDVIVANATPEERAAIEAEMGPLGEKANAATEAYSKALKESRLRVAIRTSPSNVYKWAEAMEVEITPEMQKEIDHLQKLYDESTELSDEYFKKWNSLSGLRDQGGYIEPMNALVENPFISTSEFGAFTEDEEYFQRLRDQGYDAIIWSPEFDEAMTKQEIKEAADEIESYLETSATLPYGAEVVLLYPERQMRSTITGDLLAQGPLPTEMDQYRTEQEARPVVGEIAAPIQNKDGSYRKNAQGDITGAPEGVRLQTHIKKIVNANIARMEDPLAQMPSSAEWYEVSGAAIRSVTHGDPVMTERMVRLMAVLSATTQVGGNTAGAVKAIYQLARGETAAAGRFPNKLALISQQILDAKDMSYDVPGVDSKVMSFYRNLWDATFLSDKFEGATTMDMWMARLYGYKTDTFGPAQYRFASMITQQITDAYNAKHETNLKPRQIQAVLWVYARNRERYGPGIGSDISLEDRSAFDTYLNRATQNITFETVPAVNSGLFPELHLATPEQKRSYTKDAVRLILNEKGENELFNKLGVPLYRQTPSEGTFEGVVNPNEIFSIVADKAAGVVDTGKADLASRVLQYIYTQNAVPWFQLDHTATGATQGVAIYHSAQPTPEMEDAFLEHLQTTQQIDADFTRVGNDYFLLNFTDLSNKAFKEKVVAAIDAYTDMNGPGAELMEEWKDDVKARSNYLADPREGKEYEGLDWSSPDAVTALEGIISEAGGQDLLGWARDRREAVARLQADFRDENLTTLFQGPPTIDRAVEARFVDKLGLEQISDDEFNIADPEKFDAAIAEYATLEESEGGKVINTDTARELSQEYLDDRTLSASVHEPASFFVKELYRRKLQEKPQGEEMPRVLFTAGGTGAGKSSALKSVPQTRYIKDQSQIVFDTNMNTLDSARKKVQQALDAGKDAVIVLVVRDPVESLRYGAFPRAERQRREHGSGRTVPLVEHSKTHQGAPPVVETLAEEFKDHPNVAVIAIDNTLGKGNARPVELAKIPKFDYTEVEAELTATLEDAYDKGEISEETYQGFKGVTQRVGQESRQVDGGQYQPRGQESLAQPNRGAISFTGDGALISLLEDADLSTALHELTHYFFESYMVMSDNPEIAADMQVLLDFIGIPDLNTWQNMTLEQRRAGHEKVARAGEAYFMEGKAPSLEMQSLFDTFRSWLINVYKTLRGLNAPLTDEVREVFDRMLATEEQIQSRQIANGYAPIFGSAEEGAMTALQWQDYQEKQDRAAAAAQSALERRSLRDMQWLSNAKSRLLREMQGQHKALREEMKERVTLELENTPVYQAIAFVKENKLDRAEFQNRYPNYYLPRNWTAKDGIPMDDVASELGWRSGLEMVDAMLNAAPLKEQIDRVTDQRMLEEHGDLNDPAKMNQAAEDAIRSDAHTRFLNTELNHLSKGTGISKISHQAAKAYAETAIARRKARHIKSWEYARAEARAGRNAMRALQQGDRQAAAEHKRAQVIANHFYRAARNAEKDIDGIVKYLRKFDRPGVRKNLDRDYLDQIDAITEKVGLKKVSLKEVDRRKSFAEWHEEKVKNNEQVEVPKDYVERLKTHFQEMTYEQLSGMRDNVKNIEHLGRLKHKIQVGQEMREFSETMEEGRSIALANNKQVHDPENRTPQNFKRWKKFKNTMGAWLVKIEFLAEQLDGGKENGLWWNLLFRPIADAENTDLGYKEDLSVRLAPILARDTFKDLKRKIFINNKAGYYDKNQVISMALNWGNEYNQQALIDGMADQQVSRENIEQVLNENLTPEDWQTVQEIWDLIDSYWPEISELQKRMTGVVPEKVERQPFTTPHGQNMAGGYYPLVFDSELSYKTFVRDQKLSVQELLETNFLRPSTKKGHTIERKNSGGLPVRLDIGVISQHLNNVIHDLSYREAVLQVDKVIQDHRTRDAVSRVAGLEMYQQLRPWLAAAANPNAPLIDPYEQAAKWLRKNTTIVNMGFKLSTAVVQQLGYTQTIELLGERWAMHGLAKFYGNPLKAKALTEEVLAKSTMMRNRMTSFDREINDAIMKVKKEYGVGTTMQQWAFKHIGFMDMSVSIPSWIAGYDKAQAQGMSEKDSIAMGDRAVRMSQSSGTMKDLARVQQGSEYRKLITMFFTYFSSYYNLMRRRAKISGREPLSMAKIGRNSMSVLYLTILPAVLSEIVLGRGPDDDEDEDWATWFATEALVYPLMSVPIIRDVANAAVRGFGYEITPIARGVEDMLKAPQATLNIAMGDGEEADFKRLTMAGGYIFGLPARQIWTLFDNTKALAEGDDLTLTEALMIKEQRE